MTTTEKLDLAEIMGDHAGDHECHELWHQAERDGECETFRLASLASEQAAALAQAWDEGFDKAWYEALPYEDSRDASESSSVNPYRAALAGEQ